MMPKFSKIKEFQEKIKAYNISKNEMDELFNFLKTLLELEN